MAWSNLEKTDVATFGSLESLFGNVLGAALSLIGLATFIMIVVGGFKFLTSGGDAKQADAAKATLTYGLLGLALAIGAWFILLAIKSFTGVNVTEFNVITQ